MAHQSVSINQDILHSVVTNNAKSSVFTEVNNIEEGVSENDDNQVSDPNPLNLTDPPLDSGVTVCNQHDELKRLKGELESAYQVISKLEIKLATENSANLEKAKQLEEAAEILMEQQSALELGVKRQNKLEALLAQERRDRIAVEAKFKTLRKFTEDTSYEISSLIIELQRDATSDSNRNIQGNEDNIKTKIDSLSGFVNSKLDKFEAEQETTKSELTKIVKILEKLVAIKPKEPIPPATDAIRKNKSASAKNQKEQINVKRLKENSASSPSTVFPNDNKDLIKKINHAEDFSKSVTNSAHFCICGARYTSKYKLLQHIRLLNLQGKFKCDICTELFVTLSDLKRHQSSKHKIASNNKLKYGCVECGECFARKTDFIKHGKLYHSPAASRLEMASSNDNVLEIDIKIKNELEDNPCITQDDENPSLIAANTSICSISRSRKSIGRRSSSRQKPIKHPTMAEEKREIIHYEDTENGNGEFVCGCGTKFSTHKKLEMHIRRINMGKNIACHWCSSRFYSVHCMKKHAKRKHKLVDMKPIFGCRTCGLTFDTRKLLWQHIKHVHGLKTSEQKNEIQHEADKTNKNADEPVCICGKKFDTLSRLSQHLYLYNRPWLYNCDICMKRFPFKSRLNAHMEATHNMKTQTGFRNKIKRKNLNCNRKSKTSKRITPPDLPIPIAIPIPISSDEIMNNLPSNQKSTVVQASSTSGSDTAIHQVVGMESSPDSGNYCTCGMKFVNRSNLFNHVRRNKGEKFKFQCKVCKRRYLFKSALTAHTKTSKICNRHVM